MKRCSLVMIMLVAAAVLAPALSLALAPALAGAQTPRPAAITVVPAPATALPLKHAPEPTTSEITAKDLMTRLYIFADDSMMGREAGTLGNMKGTDYLAREAKRIGLIPAGDSGTYFQTIPFKTRSLDPASTVVVGGTPLTLGTDWATAGGAAVDRSDVPVIFGGTVGDSASMLPPDQTAGKLVVLRMRAGGGNPRALRGIARFAPQAAAVALVGADQMMGAVGRPQTFLDDPQAASARAGAAGAPPLLIVSQAAAAKLFPTPLDQLTPGAAGAMVSLKLATKVEPVPFPARNVVGIVRGSDPTLRNEYVAIGAHNDHVGVNARPVDHDSIRIYNHLVRPGGAENSGNQATPEQQTQINTMLAEWRSAHPGSARLDSISNGADDDGSGSVSVLEIAEKMASLRTKPKRSILFVWHVGEEKGLLGAAYFTDHPTVPRDAVVAQLNIDMNGRGNAWDVTGLSKEGEALRGSPKYLQLVGSRRLSTELGDLVEKVNIDGKHGFVFDYAMDANSHPMNIYCRSDHYEYARYGIPITFFTTGGHSDYHQVTDEPMYIDYDRMAHVSNLVHDVAMRVANLDHRVALSAPKPDPRGACRQ
ncbi:MAG: M28 family peptidase [Gemmatimonadaceae bacterium]